MLLAVDIGNTKVKLAVFEKDVALLSVSVAKEMALKTVEEIFLMYPEISESVLSIVGKEEEKLFFWLKQHTRVFAVHREIPMPFINKYATPHTLGVDRMVLAAGATLAYPEQNRLVIDAGTCVTYDFVSAKDEYLGGAISPGLQLRYNAMHTFTAKLPLLYPEMPENYTGNSTETSLHAGAVFGLLYEIEGFIEAYLKQYQQLTVILTGGDADFLAKRLKNTIFANSNFLLESLNSLYKYSNHK
ncbi:MAG: type III pantothenate kinase [Bacteroidia bacterium]